MPGFFHKYYAMDEDKDLLWAWRRAYARHLARKDKKKLEKSRLEDEGQPRSVRMLNAIARHEDRDERYTYTPPTHHEGTDTIN